MAIEFGKTPFVAFVSFCYSRILQALNRSLITNLSAAALA